MCANCRKGDDDDDVDCLKACRIGAEAWKLRKVIWDIFGACLIALAMANGRRKMKAILGVKREGVVVQERGRGRR